MVFGGELPPEPLGVHQKANLPASLVNPEDLPLTVYTHLNFAFAFIDPKTFAVAPMSDGDTELYSRFTALKNYNLNLQTWLAGSKDAQDKFFKSLVHFMSTYGFDGVDIDWEYPVAKERFGRKVDFDNYTSFLKNLKNALSSGGKNYGLTITIPSSY
ncbi:hypothetical protein KEM56_003677 [Ascosphaera pollenicola]|nr:hypothetical protein KEM56_003677 [Ascosphaera pollenicola]